LFEVLTSDPVTVDELAFSLWLQGYTEIEATNKRLESIRWKNVSQDVSLSTLVLRDTKDQYLNFALFEKVFMAPTDNTPDFCVLQISDALLRRLVEAYYQINEPIMRHFLGKKMKVKNKREWTEVSEKMSFNPTLCRRQYDNLFRVTQFLLHHNSTEQGLTAIEQCLTVIEHHFRLSRELAHKYLRCAFLSIHHLDCHKRRLASLAYAHVDEMVKWMLGEWLAESAPQLQIDLVFIEHLRDAKALLLSNRDILENYKRLLRTHYQNTNHRAYFERLDTLFIPFMKSLLHLAGKMTQRSEFKSIFIDLMEKISPHVKGLSGDEVSMASNGLRDCFPSLLESLNLLKGSVQRRYNNAWCRFLNVIEGCLKYLIAL